MDWMNNMTASVASSAPAIGATVLTSIAAGLSGIDNIILRTVTRPFVIGLATMATAVGTLALVSSRATAEFARLGRSIIDLSTATGMSTARAGGITNRFGAFGLNAGAMMGDSDPVSLMMRARLSGAGSFDNPNAIAGMAAQFQRFNAMGPMGNRMARGMLGDMDSPELRRVLSMPLGALNSQAAFQSRVQGGLGVDPAMMARVTQQLDLMNARFNILGSGILVRIASEILPRFNANLEILSNILANNSEQIGTAISSGINAAATAARNFGMYMYAEFPPMMLGAALSVVDFALSVTESTGGIRGVFMDMLEGMRDDIKRVWARMRAEIITEGKSIKAEILTGGITGTGHPDVDRGLRALPAIDLIARTTEPLRSGTEALLKRLGVPDDWAALGGGALPTIGLGLGGRPLIGAIGRGLFGSSGAAGAAGRAGLLSRLVPLLASPAAGVIGGGLLVGGALSDVVRMARKSFGDTSAADSFGEMVGNSWGRIRDLITRNPEHYDRMMFERAHPDKMFVKAADGWRVTDRPKTAGVAGLPTMATMSESVSGLMERFGSGRSSGSGGASTLSATLQNMRESLLKKQDELGTPEERRAQLREMLAHLSNIDRNTAATADNVAYTGDELRAIGIIAGQEIDKTAKRHIRSVVSISPSTH